MTGHGINHIEKVLLIAQRLGKLSANIAACWATVRLGPMSEMGQKRRFGDVRVTSALPLKADIHRTGRHVSNVPQADFMKLQH